MTLDLEPCGLRDVLDLVLEGLLENESQKCEQRYSSLSIEYSQLGLCASCNHKAQLYVYCIRLHFYPVLLY